MESHKQQQPRKAHVGNTSLTVTAFNATNRTPPFARHSRPAGASPRCQNAPLDLTKPLDLSVKKKRPRSAERTCEKTATKCYRQIPTDGLVCKNINPAVVTPFNFATINGTNLFGRSPDQVSSNTSSRRAGLTDSSMQNYNQKDKAVVTPRKDAAAPGHVQHHQQRQYAELEREASMLAKHGHVSVSSVPYSHVTHPFSKSSSFTATVSSLSSSGNIFPSSSRKPSTSSLHRNAHSHRPMLQSAEDINVAGSFTNSVSGSISGKYTSQARIAHVTGFSRNSSSVAPRVAPSSQTHNQASSSYCEPSATFTVGVLQGSPSITPFQSSQQRPTGNQSNGMCTIQKKMRRSHSVSPMRLSRNTYGKGSDRHNVRVLKMLDSTIAAGAKITKFLPPIDGPEAPRMVSSRPAMLKEDRNNNSSHIIGTYTQPLQVDIPDHHSPSVPPVLPHALSDERMLPNVDRVEPASFCSSNMNRLSPPSSTTCDRISPTMPVLVPHSIYSPVELPRLDATDSSLPVLKKAKLDVNSCSGPQSVQYNPLTLPFMSSMSESKKIQSVPPIISQSRKTEDARYVQQSGQESLQQASIKHRHARTLSSRYENTRSTDTFNPPSQKDLEDLLMQLGRVAHAPSLSVQRATYSSARSPVPPPMIASKMSSTLPHSKSEHTFVDRGLRTLEEDREIMRRLLYKTTGDKGKLMERCTLISSEPKREQEPEIVDLTASPPPSPTVLKPEHPIEQREQEQTRNDNEHTPPKAQFLVTAKTPDLKDTTTFSSLFQTPPSLDVAEKPSTLEETIEAVFRSSYRDENAKERLESESNCARPPSIVLDSKMENESKENSDSKGDTHSFCKKHRRLLFPSESPKHESAAKTEVSGKARYSPQSQTLYNMSEVINHIITHDPRKKHLASLKREDKMSSVQVKKEAPDDVPTTISHPSSDAAPISPSLSSADAEQRRRRRLNLEINRIANTASYVGDLPKKPRSGDLLVDSSLLDREERALQVGYFVSTLILQE